jgi:hypothetical protein
VPRNFAAIEFIQQPSFKPKGIIMPDQNSQWNNPVSSGDNSAPSAPAQTATGNAPVSAAPAQQSAPQNAPKQAPPQPAHPNTLSSDDRHSFNIGKTYQSVLQGLSGGPTVSYTTDANGNMQKVLTPATPGQSWKRILASALVGLGAGAEAGQTAKPGAEGLTGLGAGAQAGMRQSLQADAQKKKDAADQFERNQQSVLAKAQIAHLNVETLKNYFTAMKAGNDMSAEFSNNKDLVKELGDAGISAKVVPANEAKALLSKDSNASIGSSDNLTTHFVVPLGFEPMMTADGQPMLDTEGKPLQRAMVGVVEGMPDGKIPVTDAFKADLDKYGKYSNIPAGSGSQIPSELEPKQYVGLMRAIGQGKAKVVEAEAHPIQAMVNGKLTYVNEVTGEPVANLKNIVPNAEDKGAAQKSTLAKNAAETNKANADATKTRADIVSDSDLSDVADAVYRGDMDLTKVTSMRGNQRAKLAQLIESRHPDFNMQNYATQLGTMKDFTSGKTSQNITALNTSIGHLDQLSQAANALQNGNIQILNHVANSLGVQIGESPVATYSAIHNAVSGEVSKTFKGASATDSEIKTMDNTFSPSQSPKQAKAALDATIHLFASRLSALNNQFKNGAGKNASERGVMLISPESQAALSRHGFNLNSDGVPQNSGASAAPAGTVHFQVPGQPDAFIPQSNLAAFKKKYPTAVEAQ